VSRMALLTAIEDAFVTLVSSRLASCLSKWQEAHSSLRDLTDADELIHRCRSPEVEAKDASAALTALSVEAAGGDRDAARFLLWVFLPQLWWARRDPDYLALDPDEIDAELVAGLWEAIVKLALKQRDRQDEGAGDRDDGPGAAGASSNTDDVLWSLINAARQQVYAAASDSREWQRHCRLSDDISHQTPSTTPPVGGHSMDIIKRALGEGVITELEADLIDSTRLGSESLRQAGQRLGLTFAAVKQRRRRAEARLRAWTADEQSIPARRGIGHGNSLERSSAWLSISSTTTRMRSLSGSTAGPAVRFSAAMMGICWEWTMRRSSS
jgi:hypothetical protein